MAAQALVSEARVATGIPGLDNILMGGFLPSRLYLIDGDPGTGKTTLGLQFLLEGVRQKEQGLYVTLSESRDELSLSAASHGWSIDGFSVIELIASEDSLKPEAQYTMFHPSEVELNETTKKVLEMVERLRPKRVVFDSLSELRLLAQSSLRYRRQVLALKQFFMGRQCTVLLLDDLTSEPHDMQVHSISHGVIRLEQLLPEFGSERRRLRVMKMRGMEYRGGYHDFRLKRGGLDMFPRLQASAAPMAPFDGGRLKSGSEGIDHLLGGGLDRGTCTLLLGPAGCGKSSIAALYAVAAAERGERSALFLFDENIRTLRVRCAGLGMPLDRYLDAGLINVMHIDPAELTPGEFDENVRRALDDDGVTLIVIDSLNGYLNAMPEERFLITRLHEIFMYLGRRGVTTIMVEAQHGVVGTQLQGAIDTSYLADTVVLLRYFEAQGKLRRAISVVKKRSGAHEPTIRELSFAPDGISVGEPLHEFQGILTGVPVFAGQNSSLQ